MMKWDVPNIIVGVGLITVAIMWYLMRRDSHKKNEKDNKRI